jgi:alanine racemase
MKPQDDYSTWAEVDLSAIESNVRLLTKHTGVQLMAVVKADGYGHGALLSAAAALRGGATWFGVARVEEALELREGDISSPILVLGWTPPARVRDLAAARVSITVWDPAQIEVGESGDPVRVHLKIDTGMSRLGAPPERAVELARMITSRPGLIFEGIFTHFARADEPAASTTEMQEKTFREVVDTLQASGLRPELAHAANSAGALTRPGAGFDMVRSGIAIYGLHPSGECLLPSSDPGPGEAAAARARCELRSRVCHQGDRDDRHRPRRLRRWIPPDRRQYRPGRRTPSACCRTRVHGPDPGAIGRSPRSG